MDADTHKPMKGVKIGHRDLRTMLSDSEKVIFFFEVWHPFPTRDDGMFKCRLDPKWWHVLHFCPPDCAGDDDTDHLDTFVTISPEPVMLLIGDSPKEGTSHRTEGLIPVELETVKHRREKILSSGSPATRPSATRPLSEQ